MRRAAFIRRNAADHFGAVSHRLLGMVRTFTASDALADDFGVLVLMSMDIVITLINCNRLIFNHGLSCNIAPCGLIFFIDHLLVIAPQIRNRFAN